MRLSPLFQLTCVRSSACEHWSLSKCWRASKVYDKSSCYILRRWKNTSRHKGKPISIRLRHFQAPVVQYHEKYGVAEGTKHCPAFIFRSRHPGRRTASRQYTHKLRDNLRSDGRAHVQVQPTVSYQKSTIQTAGSQFKRSHCQATGLTSK